MMEAIEIVRASVPVPSQLLVEDVDEREQIVVIRVSSTQTPVQSKTTVVNAREKRFVSSIATGAPPR